MICQDDFLPYENSLKLIYKDDQLTLCSILMLNTALKIPFIVDHAEETCT